MLVIEEEPVWAARFACLISLINGETPSSASRAMVRELFECLQSNLPDDLGIEIVIHEDNKRTKGAER